MRDGPAHDADAEPALLLKAFLVLVVGFALIVGGIAVATRGARADGWSGRIERAAVRSLGLTR